MLNTLRSFALPAVLLSAIVAGPALADEVYLADGSKLVGVVEGASPTTLSVKTGFAGTVAIELAKVVGVSTDEPRTVAMVGGERVVGKLAFADGKMTVVSDTLGAVPVSSDKLAGIWAVGGEPVAAGEVPAQVQAVKEEAAKAAAAKDAQIKQLEEELAKHKDPWAVRLEIGLAGQTGTVEETALRGRIEAKRDVGAERLLTYLQGAYTERNNERSTNEIMGGIKLERDISERWFVFGKLDLEYDEFEDLDLRSTATVGLGYFVIRKADHEWKLRGGVGYQHQSFADGTSADDAVLELGYDYMVELAPWLRFVQSVTYYPTFSEIRDYLLHHEAAGEIPLSKENNWKLRLGVRNEYDPMPRPGVERLDTTYFLNLLYDFQ